MRMIREMLGNDEKVWVYLNSEDTWRQFIDMAVAEGFHFGDLPVDKWTFGYVIAVHSNGNMGHLPLFVWCLSFQKDADNCPQKLDFEKYIKECEDYKCRDPHFRQRLFSIECGEMY